MKVVLDTNVVVSGVLFSGPPQKILTAWHAAQFELVASPAILDEYARVGTRLEERYGSLCFEAALSVIAANATIIDAPPLKKPLCDDPDDDKFIACAIAARSRIVVSGDRHLLAVSGFRRITVFRPRVFLDRYLS